MRNVVLIILIGMTSYTSNATGDSLFYLLPQDSVLLHVGDYQEKFFLHTIEKKQTLFSLAKFYGLKVQELYYYNPGLKEKGTSIGDPVRIPIPNKAILRYTYPGFIPTQFARVYYVVRKGDTMFRIAKYYFRMPVEDIMARNQLSSTTLKTGQVLHIGWISLVGVPEDYRRNPNGPYHPQNEALQKIYYERVASKTEKSGQGIAVWQKNSQNKSELYALHRLARVDSVIEITNPMTHRTIFAKVIGSIPATAYPDNVEVILSPLAAQLLGAKDPQFFVQVKHYR
ncbi:MAG: LysM peptidoglycan-binding domain-containing protein [Saprospiraceae bacterium]